MKLLSPAPDGGMSHETRQAIRSLKMGDVLLVAKQMKDRHKVGKTFTWRFFALVTEVHTHRCEAMVLDEKERDAMPLSFFDEKTVVQLLDESEWPDGVHAFRTKAILEGRLPGLV